MPRKQAANPKRGEAVAPKIGILRYSWDSIERLANDVGQDFDEQLVAAVNSYNLSLVALIASYGCDLDPDEIKDMSPPIEPTFQAISNALRYSFRGEIDELGDYVDNDEADEPKKKSQT